MNETKTCPRCGETHTDNYDIDVMTEQGNDVQQGGCETCWIESYVGRFPLILDTETIERVVHHDPTA